ncbi:hypothetical protein LTR62_006196 [Meristemomyces frigidus]|uniref:UmuC domain-containing protein n=1 Tax=Meristemomyces frigidus TaxID=1508187 RepID=A0AAN7TD89_9PEZI|nr:hypothetical protein LTR62_006196 [Meristemomyces frigidus]
MDARKVPPRKDGRVIIHFDYDCFYAAVFEAKNPSLKSLPFAVQQKQIIVTCNYEARRRGLHKLQLIRDAKRICPDVIIELGEDISRFRDASKELYNFIKAFSWNGKVERLGFDEVWMDVTDIIDHNIQVLNRHSVTQSFFQTSKDDPMAGFKFDASSLAGHPYPPRYAPTTHVVDFQNDLGLRLRLGSHLALYIRHQLEQQKGYTSTVGIATSKLLAKLVGNLNKPKGQTTLIPPLACEDGRLGNAQLFMDGHGIGQVPGIGYKLARLLRSHILQKPPEVDTEFLSGGKKETVTVADVRQHPDIDPAVLEKVIGGPGSPHGIGFRVWCLIHGIDDTEVSQAKVVPSQISIEDSYIRLDTMPELLRELTTLAKSLLARMRIDLLVDEDRAPATDDLENGAQHGNEKTVSKRWLAHPKTLRLTTRPRQPLQADGTRIRSFKRISHSAPLPTFVFALNENVETLADQLVTSALTTMFRKLHPEKSGWNLSLVNLGVTNMAETAGESRTASGRHIGHMFRRQDDVLKDFRVTATEEDDKATGEETGSEGEFVKHDSWQDDEIEAEDEEEHIGEDGLESCPDCSMRLPSFALVAHRRFHVP